MIGLPHGAVLDVREGPLEVVRHEAAEQRLLSDYIEEPLIDRRAPEIETRRCVVCGGGRAHTGEGKLRRRCHPVSDLGKRDRWRLGARPCEDRAKGNRLNSTLSTTAKTTVPSAMPAASTHRVILAHESILPLPASAGLERFSCRECRRRPSPPHPTCVEGRATVRGGHVSVRTGIQTSATKLVYGMWRPVTATRRAAEDATRRPIRGAEAAWRGWTRRHGEAASPFQVE